jgi:dolichol-phosphate mannosyltransferase
VRPTLVARAAATAVVAVRLARGARSAPAIEPEAATEPEAHISVVIPARDEAARIAAAVHAVVGAPGVVEVIVVDDDSIDATADVAAAAGARVIEAGPRPTGWAGKTWAVDRGVRSSVGDWVVTLDADARADLGLPSAVVARAASDALDLVTVAGHFGPGDAGAQWLHAAMLSTLVYRFGPPGTTHRPGRTIANGQCMVFRRDEFVTWGGFAPVRDSPVEDVALARFLAGGGRHVGFLDGRSLLTIEPYPTLGATWTGWGRSLGLPGVESDLQRWFDVVTLALVMPMPLIRLLCRRSDLVDVVALAMRVGVMVATRRVYDRRGLAFWASPLADALAVGAVASGGFRRRQVWRGRTYETPGMPVRTSRR